MREDDQGLCCRFIGASVIAMDHADDRAHRQVATSCVFCRATLEIKVYLKYLFHLAMPYLEISCLVSCLAPIELFVFEIVVWNLRSQKSSALREHIVPAGANTSCYCSFRA